MCLSFRRFASIVLPVECPTVRSYTQPAASRAAVHRSSRRAKRRRTLLGHVVPWKYGIITVGLGASGRARGEPPARLDSRDRPPLRAGATTRVSRIPRAGGRETRGTGRSPPISPSRSGGRRGGGREEPLGTAKDGDGSAHRRPGR